MRVMIKLFDTFIANYVSQDDDVNVIIDDVITIAIEHIHSKLSKVVDTNIIRHINKTKNGNSVSYGFNFTYSKYIDEVIRVGRTDIELEEGVVVASADAGIITVTLNNNGVLEDSIINCTSENELIDNMSEVINYLYVLTRT